MSISSEKISFYLSLMILLFLSTRKESPIDIDVLYHRYSKEKHTGNPVDDYSFSLLGEGEEERKRPKCR